MNRFIGKGVGEEDKEKVIVSSSYDKIKDMILDVSCWNKKGKQGSSKTMSSRYTEA